METIVSIRSRLLNKFKESHNVLDGNRWVSLVLKNMIVFGMSEEDAMNATNVMFSD